MPKFKVTHKSRRYTSERKIRALDQLQISLGEETTWRGCGKSVSTTRGGGNLTTPEVQEQQNPNGLDWTGQLHWHDNPQQQWMVIGKCLVLDISGVYEGNKDPRTGEDGLARERWRSRVIGGVWSAKLEWWKMVLTVIFEQFSPLMGRGGSSIFF